MEKKKLYRSVTDRKIAGVCGGIAEYLNIDPTTIRLLWALFALVVFATIPAYIICAVVIPEPPEADRSNENPYTNTEETP